MPGERRCAWDGDRAIDELCLGGTIDRSSHRWILTSVDDGGRDQRFTDARLEQAVDLYDGSIVSIVCWAEFFAPGCDDNLIGTELWELEATIGHRFTPDAVADEVVFEAEEVGLTCIVMDGRVTCIWLSDFDLVDDGPEVFRPVGVG